MLTLTDNAADVVKQITDQNTSGADAGLRISQEESAEQTGLALSPVEEPEVGDQLVEDNGARVFLDESAASLLDDKVLDAQVDPDGSVQFGIGTLA